MTPPAQDHDPTHARREFDAHLDAARSRYEASVDGTLGIEEEFAICDPATLDLVAEYERLAAIAHEHGLGHAVAGELLASEIEFRTGRCERWSDAVVELTDIRRRAGEVARAGAVLLGSSATHPWADYREQEKVDLPYYRRLVERMQYVAHRNNTFGLHVHVGVQGADRAIRVHDALREFMPYLLALSASSPFLDGRDSGLASARALTFSRTFPRGNIAPAFRTLDGYLEYLRWLRDVGSIDTVGQVWWGTRPHVMHGTVELRMFDGQPDVRDTLALAALAAGVVALLCDLDDAGELPEPCPSEAIDENCWRATRYGTDAELIDFDSNQVMPARELIGRLIEAARGAGQRAGLGIDPGLDRAQEMLAAGCSAHWQRATFEQTGDLAVAYRSVVDATMSSASEPVSG